MASTVSVVDLLIGKDEGGPIDSRADLFVPAATVATMIAAPSCSPASSSCDDSRHTREEGRCVRRLGPIAECGRCPEDQKVVIVYPIFRYRTSLAYLNYTAKNCPCPCPLLMPATCIHLYHLHQIHHSSPLRFCSFLACKTRIFTVPLLLC